MKKIKDSSLTGAYSGVFDDFQPSNYRI